MRAQGVIAEPAPSSARSAAARPECHPSASRTEPTECARSSGNHVLTASSTSSARAARSGTSSRPVERTLAEAATSSAGRHRAQPLADAGRVGGEERLPERPGAAAAVPVGARPGRREGARRLHEERGEEHLDPLEVGLEADHRAEAELAAPDHPAAVGRGDRVEQHRLGPVVGVVDADAAPLGRRVVPPVRRVGGSEHRRVDAVPRHQGLGACGEGLGLGLEGRRLGLGEEQAHLAEDALVDGRALARPARPPPPREPAARPCRAGGELLEHGQPGEQVQHRQRPRHQGEPVDATLAVRVEQSARRRPPRLAAQLTQLRPPAGVDARRGVAAQLVAHDVDDETLLGGVQPAPGEAVHVARLPPALPRHRRRGGEAVEQARDHHPLRRRRRAPPRERDGGVIEAVTETVVEGVQGRAEERNDLIAVRVHRARAFLSSRAHGGIRHRRDAGPDREPVDDGA